MEFALQGWPGQVALSDLTPLSVSRPCTQSVGPAGETGISLCTTFSLNDDWLSDQLATLHHCEGVHPQPASELQPLSFSFLHAHIPGFVTGIQKIQLRSAAGLLYWTGAELNHRLNTADRDSQQLLDAWTQTKSGILVEGTGCYKKAGSVGVRSTLSFILSSKSQT